MEVDSDDENLVVGGGLDQHHGGGLDQHHGGGLDHLEPQGADGGASPQQPNLASAVMPPEMYETEWEAFQLSIQRFILEMLCSKSRLIFCSVRWENLTCLICKTLVPTPQSSTRRTCQTWAFLRFLINNNG